MRLRVVSSKKELTELPDKSEEDARKKHAQTASGRAPHRFVKLGKKPDGTKP